MPLSYLIYEKQVAAGEHVRIWRQQDGRFSFEHLMPTGKGSTVLCATLQEALMLRDQIKKNASSSLVILPAPGEKQPAG